MKISTRLIAILWMVSTPIAASAESADDAYEAARTSYQSLKKMPEESLKLRHHWQKTIDKFEAVAEKHPKSSVADDALYMAGTLHYDLYDVSRYSSDLKNAVASFRSCSKSYPESNYADDCLFWESKALHLLGSHADEMKALRAISDRYPKGDMAKDARAQIAKLADDVEHRATAVAVVATPKPTVTVTPVATVPKTRSGGEESEESRAVTNVKVWSNEGYTRVGIYLGGNAKWTVNDLKADGDKPPRIYMDVTRAHVGETLKTQAAKLGNDWEVPIGDGLLQRARVNQFTSDTVRVVLDVKSMESYEILQFDDPYRVLIDVTGVGGAKPVLVAAATPVPAATAKPMTAAELQRAYDEATKISPHISFAEQLGLKATRIFVDAGHGGHDPGAQGPTGLREKDVTLTIAKKVQTRLIALGYDAVLTRKDDTFLELEERTGIANGGKGDLFLSIHCNSHDPKSKHTPSGVETYFAFTASDAAAARLSAMENATTTESMSGLTGVLENLARSEFTRLSADLAGSVQKSLYGDIRKKHNAKSHDYGVKSALFYVLLTARMPAILVETSFISNKADEKRLRDPKYLDTIADSIAGGVETYLDTHAFKAVSEQAAKQSTTVR